MKVRNLAHCGAAYWLSWLLIGIVALIAFLIGSAAVWLVTWL